MLRSRIALLSALLALAHPATAQEQLMREVIDTKTNSYAEVTALFSHLPSHGFAPVRVTLSNQTKEDRSARFECASSDGAGYGGNGMKMESSFEVTAKSGETVTRDLMVPVATYLNTSGYSGCELRVAMRGGFNSADGRIDTTIDPSHRAVLMSSDLHTKNASVLDKAMTTSGSSSGRAEFAGSFQPNQLPEDWRAYAGYDVILMTDADWRKVPTAARRAVQQWLRLGGYLRIYQPTGRSIPADLELTPNPTNANQFHCSSGTVELDTIASDLSIGTDIINQLKKPTQLPPQANAIRDSFSSTGWPLQVLLGNRGFSYGLFLLVLVAFAVVVGPVNMFVFAKSSQRHRLFFTTPVISLAASILLIAMIFMQDGLGGRGMRVVLCEVRPEAEENLAYLTQEQICRTGVLLGSSFKIDSTTVATPVPMSDTAWSRLSNSYGKANGTYAIQGQDDGSQRVTGDWFQSRSEQGQLVKSVIPTRGRLEAVANTSQPTIFSTFDFPLETVVFKGADGKFFRADNVVAGQRIELKEISQPEFVRFTSEQSNRFSARNKEVFERLYTRPGHYVAVTRNAPGVETLSSIRWTETTTVITGPLVK